MKTLSLIAVVVLFAVPALAQESALLPPSPEQQRITQMNNTLVQSQQDMLNAQAQHDAIIARAFHHGVMPNSNANTLNDVMPAAGNTTPTQAAPVTTQAAPVQPSQGLTRATSDGQGNAKDLPLMIGNIPR